MVLAVILSGLAGLVAVAAGSGEAGMAAIKLLLAKGQTDLIEQALADGNLERATATAEVLGSAADGRGVPLLLALLDDDARPIALRFAATV